MGTFHFSSHFSNFISIFDHYFLAEIKKASAKWNFDFEKEIPCPSSEDDQYDWSPVPESSVPNYLKPETSSPKKQKIDWKQYEQYEDFLKDCICPWGGPYDCKYRCLKNRRGKRDTESLSGDENKDEYIALYATPPTNKNDHWTAVFLPPKKVVKKSRITDKPEILPKKVRKVSKSPKPEVKSAVITGYFKAKRRSRNEKTTKIVDEKRQYFQTRSTKTIQTRSKHAVNYRS